jgi:hypothetical protein
VSQNLGRPRLPIPKHNSRTASAAAPAAVVMAATTMADEALRVSDLQLLKHICQDLWALSLWFFKSGSPQDGRGHCANNSISGIWDGGFTEIHACKGSVVKLPIGNSRFDPEIAQQPSGNGSREMLLETAQQQGVGPTLG